MVEHVFNVMIEHGLWGLGRHLLSLYEVKKSEATDSLCPALLGTTQIENEPICDKFLCSVRERLYFFDLYSTRKKEMACPKSVKQLMVKVLLLGFS
jgi:hypothetical protein